MLFRSLVPLVGVTVIVIQNRFANKQLKPNGGDSMRDAIDRMEAKQDEHSDGLADILASQSDHSGQIAVIGLDIAGVKDKLDDHHDRIARLENGDAPPPTPIPVQLVQERPA